MSEILQAKISTVRRKQVIVALATGIAGAIGAFLLGLAVSMMIDFWWAGSGLGFTARAALLALNLAVVVWILLYSVFGPIIYGPDDDEIALMVEDAEPAFRTRLIASIQLSREGAVPADASSSLIRAMIAQAESLAGPMDFGRVIKTESLVRTVMLSLLCVIVTGGAFVWGGDVAKDLLKRAFLSSTPVPRKTSVFAITDNLLIAKGDSVEIIAMAQGVIPEQGKLFIKTKPEEKEQSVRTQEFTLDRIKDIDAKRLEGFKAVLKASSREAKQTDEIAGKLSSSSAVYSVLIENVQESFEYVVRLNDNESQKYTVRVLPRPAVTKVDAKQIYPQYTHKAVEPKPLGDLALLKGSKLQLVITVNKKLGKATAKDAMPNYVHLIGSDKDVPLAIDEKTGNMLQGDVEIPKGTTGFSINLTDEFGLKSKDPAVYRIDLVDDKAPTVRILLPTRKEVALVREGKQRIIFEATDDFAIGGASIKYRIDEGSESSVLLKVPNNPPPKSLRGEYTWKLNEIQPPNPAKPTLEGSMIEYWVEVEDTKDAANGGVNRGVSDHYMIRVVSESELRGILATRIADIGSGLRTAADDQETVANKVGTILLEKKVETPATSQPVAPK